MATHELLRVPAARALGALVLALTTIVAAALVAIISALLGWIF